MKGVPVEIMTAQSVDETLSVVLGPDHGIRSHTFDIIGNLAVAGVGLTGKLALEAASATDAVGDWAPLGGGPIDLSTMVPSAAATKVRMSISFTDIILNAVRGRIDVVVAGGTVSLVYTGQ
jgi:hypothetical protein